MKPSPPESRKISPILRLTWYACRPFSVVKLRVIKFYPIGLQGLVRFYPRNWISWGGDHLTMHVSRIQLSGGPYQL
jgi:hypothetical protein